MGVRMVHATGASMLKLRVACTLRLHRLRRLRSGRTKEKAQEESPVRAERSGSEVEARAHFPCSLRTDLEQTRYYTGGINVVCFSSVLTALQCFHCGHESLSNRLPCGHADRVPHPGPFPSQQPQYLQLFFALLLEWRPVICCPFLLRRHPQMIREPSQRHTSGTEGREHFKSGGIFHGWLRS